MHTFPSSLRVDASPILIKCLDGIEAFHVHMVAVCNESVAHVHPIEITNASAEAYITKILALLYGIYSAKFAEIAGGVIDSTSGHNYLVFAYCARGFIETTATLRFYNNKAQKLFEGASDPDAFSAAELREIAILLDKHARGGRFDWARYFKEGRKDMVDELIAARTTAAKPAASNPSQVNVKTTIDAWISREPTIALIYDFFCELVHPNMGSNFLVMGADSESLYAAGRLEKGIGRSLTIEGLQLLAPVVREATACLAKLMLWKATCEKATAKNSSH